MKHNTDIINNIASADIVSAMLDKCATAREFCEMCNISEWKLRGDFLEYALGCYYDTDNLATPKEDKEFADTIALDRIFSEDWDALAKELPSLGGGSMALLETRVADWNNKRAELRFSGWGLLRDILKENDGEIDLRACCHPNRYVMTSIVQSPWDDARTNKAILSIGFSHDEKYISLLTINADDYDDIDNGDDLSLEEWEDEGANYDELYDYDFDTISELLYNITAYLNK